MNPIKKPKQFAYDLSDWYRHHHRKLAFRETNDPYFIFLSEMMLQQTQVQTMLPYFEQFTKRFPTIQSLAEASLDEVLKLWEGLGYYRRARYVHESARMIMDEHEGKFPEDLKAIQSLKGVGKYTAGAIHSIAYNKPTPAVDGNVMRVMSRVTGYPSDIMETKSIREIEKLVAQLIHYEEPSDFTQALMELGALVCVRTPKCEACPIRDYCFAYKQNKQSLYPIKKSAKQKVTEHYITFVVEHNNQLYLSRRPKTGLLANMLGLPQYQGQSLEQALKAFETETGFVVLTSKAFGQVDHVFSHRIWHMRIYKVSVHAKSNEHFYDADALPSALSRAHQKVLAHVKK